MSVAAPNTYPNWSLGERKSIKAAESQLAAANATLQMKVLIVVVRDVFTDR
jgi:hypothetical protein